MEDNLKETPKEVVTDGGYVSKDTIVAMKQRAIEYIAPCVDEAGKGQSSYDQRGVSAEYQSSQFVYDAQTNSYLCPQGKILSYEGKEQRHLQVSYRYRAQRLDCEGCPMKSQCCAGNRVVGRSVHRSEELAEVAEFRQKMQSQRAREIYKTRAQVAETPNLWIKAKFGLRQFSVRGLAKVGMEALWACLTYTSECGCGCAGEKRWWCSPRREKDRNGSCRRKNGPVFESLSSGSTVRIRIITAQVDFF